MKIVDYEILVQKLVPPMGGGQKYYAVMQFVIVETPNGNQNIGTNLSETYGKTESEARSKMQAKFDQWRMAKI